MTEVDLLRALQANIQGLETLLKKATSHWTYEDGIYRFYHQSFKVYGLQEITGEIVSALQALAPECELNPWFAEIISEGTGRKFERDHNQRWLGETRPILEGFLHAKFFLEMACKYGRELDEPPKLLPSGWAAFLYLYNLR